MSVAPRALQAYRVNEVLGALLAPTAMWGLWVPRALEDRPASQVNQALQAGMVWRPIWTARTVTSSSMPMVFGSARTTQATQMPTIRRMDQAST